VRSSPHNPQTLDEWQRQQMTPEIAELISVDDYTTLVDTVDRFRLTATVATLRRARSVPSSLEAAERLTEALYSRYPTDHVVITVRAAVLKDCGHLHQAAQVLAGHLHEMSDSFYLRVVASVLWHMELRTSASFAFELADRHSSNAGHRTPLTFETVQTLRERLLGTWLPNTDFYRLSEQGAQPLKTDSELAPLETPVAVDGLPTYTLRPLKSKRQLARAANHLQNCLNSYHSQIVQGTTLLFAVERDGTPIEAIEVNPSTRRVVQWKGVSNRPPNSTTKPVIERTLKNVAGIRAQVPAEDPWFLLNAPF